MSKLILSKKVIKEQTTVSKPTFFHRFFTFRNILVSLVISFLVLTVFAKFYPYFQFDLLITHSVQKIAFPLWSELMYVITLIGNSPWAILLVLLVIVVSLLLGKKKDALMILVSTTGAIIISNFFKLLINRPRPDSNLILQLDKFTSTDSFPSGHVLYYVGFFGFLLFLTYTNFKKNILRQFLLFSLSLLLILVGFSRIYRGAHWFSDVLGAYLIGSVWLFIMINIYQKIKTKN